MNDIKTLMSRNMKLYLRDKTSVFFSLLSTMIIVALYFLFIAKMYTSSMDSLGADAVELIGSETRNFIVYLQMMAGVLVLNSMSIATGVFSTIAKDFETKRVESFLLTPIKPKSMIISYYFSGIVVSYIFNIITWFLSFVAIGFATGYWLELPVLAVVLIVLLVASFISCSFMLFITAAVKSSTALGVMNGIAGTIVGFLCGIYMPYTNLGNGTKMIGSILPFTHLTIWLKRVLLNNAFEQTNIPNEYRNLLLDEFFSAESVGLVGINIKLSVMLVLSGAVAVVFMISSWALLNKSFKKQ